MPKFMLLLHHTPGSFEKLSPAEIQQIVQSYGVWLEGMKSSERYVVSDKLMDEGGKVLTLKDGEVTVVDGPYSETKEVIGGYFTIRASNYEEAVGLVRDCPFLQGGTIIIRQTDPMGCGDE